MVLPAPASLSGMLFKLKLKASVFLQVCQVSVFADVCRAKKL